MEHAGTGPVFGPSRGTALQQLQRLHERDKAAWNKTMSKYMNLETEEVVVAPVHEFAVEAASLLPRRLDFGWAGEEEEEEKGEEKREAKAEEKQAAGCSRFV